MERLNLNVPEGVRKDLRRIAKRRGLKEAEAARALLVHAIEEAEKEEFVRAMSAATTPELRERLGRIADAMDKLDG